MTPEQIKSKALKSGYEEILKQRFKDLTASFAEVEYSDLCPQGLERLKKRVDNSIQLVEECQECIRNLREINQTPLFK